jgi:hypothetical protein
MIGGGVVEFGDCPRCPGNPTLELETRDHGAKRVAKP